MIPDTKSSKSVSLAIITLVLISTVPTTVAAVDGNRTVIGHPGLSANVMHNKFAPGTAASAKLYLQNEGVVTQGGPAAYENRVKTARATSLSITANGNPISVDTTDYPVGDLPAGVNGPYAIDLTIPEGTKPGTYYLTVHAHYKYTAAVHYDPTQPEYVDYQRDRTFKVPVVVKDRATFNIVQSDSNVQINQRGRYNLTIKNTGTEVAKHAVVQVQSQTQSVTVGASGRTAATTVDRWAPGANKTLTYDVSIADTTSVHSYAVPVDISFADEDGITRHSNRLVASFRPAPKQQFELRNVQSSLTIGRSDGTLSGTIVNTGPSRIHDAELLLGGNASGISFNQRSIGLPPLDPGQATTFTFNGGTVPSVNISEVTLPVTVSYDNPTNDRYRSSQHRVTAEIQANSDLFEIEAVTTIPAGTRGDSPKDSDWTQLKLRVTNHGSQTLHHVRPSLVFNSQYFERPIESNYRTSEIQTLKPGQSKNGTFAVSASSTAGGTTYPLDVQVRYQEPNGVTRQTRAYTVPVTITKQSSIPLLPVGGGAVILMGFLIGGFIWWRREPS